MSSPAPLPRRLGAELLGTALLLATVVGSGVMGEQLAGGNVAIALLANTIATGAGLVVYISVLGPISGAHFNPVVTAVMAARGALPARDAAAYLVAQIAGAIAGVWLAHAMFGLPLVQVSDHARADAGQWISEAVATFGLLLTILGSARRAPEQTPARVGLYIVAAYWFTASTSFANPAVTLARAFTDTFAGIRMSDVPGFVVAQAAGAALAAVTWAALDPDPPA
jgi:glycerol uptake facilitator-like aquaporin